MRLWATLVSLGFVLWSAFALDRGGCPCFTPYQGEVKEEVRNAMPHTYISIASLPESWDWRNVNGTNYASKVVTQQSPNVCGSCWAEAATSALSDRYAIATGGRLKVQLAPQVLLNFNPTTSGGSCSGGDDLKAYDFIHKYGIVDDTCAAFLGVSEPRGFVVGSMKDIDEVRRHQCYQCEWNGVCSFVDPRNVNFYGVDEFGTVVGESQMMTEIFARGPISCALNSEASNFVNYHGGVIKCPKDSSDKSCYGRSDHVVVIAGFGVDKDGTKYWVGRNSYGTRWGEGAGGGWFRLERGVNALNVESSPCRWATPLQESVQIAIKQFDAAAA